VTCAGGLLESFQNHLFIFVPAGSNATRAHMWARQPVVDMSLKATGEQVNTQEGYRRHVFGIAHIMQGIDFRMFGIQHIDGKSR
jgi:hypothetical protein